MKPPDVPSRMGNIILIRSSYYDYILAYCRCSMKTIYMKTIIKILEVIKKVSKKVDSYSLKQLMEECL